MHSVGIPDKCPAAGMLLCELPHPLSTMHIELICALASTGIALKHTPDSDALATQSPWCRSTGMSDSGLSSDDAIMRQ